MPIGLGSGLWGVVLPVDAANIHQNPSWEFGTTGAAAIQGATLGSTSQFQRFGAWSLKVTPSSNGTSGALVGTYTTGAGTTYSVSVWAFVEQGVAMRLGVGDQNGVNLQSNGTATFTGGGTWQWYSAPALTENSTTTRGIVLQKSSGVSQLSYYVDGVMVNPWTDSIDRVITYFDGDTGGGTWLGGQQASASVRSGQYRGGGSIVALGDLGLQVDQMLGAGVMPVEVSTQSFAITDGAQFQRQRAAQRKFTLTAKPISGTSLADFHGNRRTLFDALKPDLVTPQQPIHFLYYGGQGTVGIDAYYDKGLELGAMDGPVAESAAIGFVATDPYWYAPTQQGTTLAPRVALGSSNFIMRRSSLGVWGTLGANGTTVQYNATTPTIRAFQFNQSGTLFLGGEFGSVAGTVFPHIGMYYPTSNTFGTLAGGTVQGGGGGLYALAASPSGTLFLGGQFNIVGGTTTFNVARWNGAQFGTLQGGTLSGGVNAVEALLYSPTGTLIVAGGFGTAGGTRAFNIAFWTGAYGTLAGNGGVGSAVGEGINCLAWGADNRIFVGGNFSNVGGTIGTSIGFFKNGTFGTMGNATGNSIVNALGVGPNGVLYEAGFFSGFSGATETNVARWNGVQHSPMGSGLGNTALNELAHTMTVDQQTGNVYVGGQFSVVNGINAASNYAQWNGYTWLLPDISISSPGTLWAMALGPDRSLYIGGIFSGTAQAAAVGTIVNTGRAQVYPSVRWRNLGAGTARIYQLLNTLTGDSLYFNYVMQPGESAALTLQPGQRAFQSSAQGNIIGLILPGSNLATWALLPGINYVSHFCDSGSVETSLIWQPRGWSIDSGTVF